MNPTKDRLFFRFSVKNEQKKKKILHRLLIEQQNMSQKIKIQNEKKTYSNSSDA